jgi:hypothetical protein
MMKTRIRRITFALVACAVLGATALAGVKGKNVTFQEDLTVGDTLVKKGDYKVTFDDQAQELKVLKGGKVVAQTTAHTGEVKSGRYKTVYTTLKAADGTKLLSSVDMGGGYAVISSERVAAARSGQDSK